MVNDMVNSYSSFCAKFPFIKFAYLKPAFERISNDKIIIDGDSLLVESTRNPEAVRSAFRLALNYVSEGLIDRDWFMANEWVGDTWEFLDAPNGDGTHKVWLPKLCV